jgi:TRAP-type mannitol/chloroaromatic compound transport system substrate-binding protein
MKTKLMATAAALAMTGTLVSAETLEMQSIYPNSLPLLGAAGAEMGARVSRLTGGALDIKFHNPGELVNSNEIWDSVSTGAIQAGWYSPGFAEGVIPSASLFTAFPFGPGAVEYSAWWYDGGGEQLWAEITEPFNIHSELCTILAPEASGWFREPIESPADLQGLKVRFFGLGASVLEKLGAQAQSLPISDTMSALNLGTIDAAEVSFPAIDAQLGMNQHANNYYFPGWHQQSSLIVFIINKDVWNGLEDSHQAAIEEVCAANVAKTISMGEVIQLEPLQKLKDAGVDVRTWSPEMLAVFEEKWLEVAAEKSAEDADFDRVWKHVSAFRETYKGWADIGYLK